jgi:lysine-specific demethylase 8
MATGGEKRAALLRQITEEGGFAFVASAEKAAAGDLRAAEAAREMAWEQLHSAPRAEVGAAAWRDAYALACLHVAGLRAAAGDRRAALRALDMGLIMGGGLLRAELDDAVAGLGRGEAGAVPVADGDVQRWEEGIAGGRDLADVSISVACRCAYDLASASVDCVVQMLCFVQSFQTFSFTNGVIGLDCSVSVRSGLLVGFYV